MNAYSLPGIVAKEPMKEIADRFCEKAKVDFAYIASTKTRKYSVANIRFALVYYIRIYSKASWREIAEFLGGWDHKAMCYAAGMASERAEIYAEYREWIQSLDPYGETIGSCKNSNQ